MPEPTIPTAVPMTVHADLGAALDVPADTEPGPWVRLAEIEMTSAKLRARRTELVAQMVEMQIEAQEIDRTLAVLDADSVSALAALRAALATHYAGRVTTSRVATSAEVVA